MLHVGLSLPARLFPGFGRLFRATEVQPQAWKEIKNDNSVLIAAPTGSGKTLASFLAAINDKEGSKTVL